MNPYNVLKEVYPVKTTAHKGVNVHELVKAKYPLHYKNLLLYAFDWENDLDGILDYLYGERELGLICTLYGLPHAMRIDITEIIKLIENNCEVKK